MNSFFDNTHTVEELAQSWKDRKAALKAEEEEEFCDMLYKSIYQNILTRRDAIYADMKRQIATATDIGDLKVTLWTYWQVEDLNPVGNYDDTLEELKERGEEWVVYNAARTKDMRVADVVYNTYLLARLRMMFGPKFNVVDVSTGSWDVCDSVGEWKSYGYALVLHYYPDAPNTWGHYPALDKYQDRPLRPEEPKVTAGRWSVLRL